MHTARDRRLGQRKTMRVHCRIHTTPESPGVEAVVVDLSATGARIELSWEVALPDRFRLQVEPSDEIRNVELVRRERKYARVRFMRHDESFERHEILAVAPAKRVSLAELRQIPVKAATP